jgi:AcrR family transcriptional regulator
MSKRLNASQDDRRASILVAAKEAFSRYGYARTSMADIAGLARISRPALYEHFSNKEDVYRSLAESLSAKALAAADAAWPASVSFEEGLAAAILAKDLDFFRLIHLSPHGSEIVAAHAEVTADLHARMENQFAELVAKHAARTVSAELVGRIIARAVEGLKQGAGSEKEFIASVRRFAKLVAEGI